MWWTLALFHSLLINLMVVLKVLTNSICQPTSAKPGLTAWLLMTFTTGYWLSGQLVCREVLANIG